MRNLVTWHSAAVPGLNVLANRVNLTLLPNFTRPAFQALDCHVLELCLPLADPRDHLSYKLFDIGDAALSCSG